MTEFPLNVSLELSLDTVVGDRRYVVHGDSEGYEQTTLADAIVLAAVDRIHKDVAREEIVNEVRARVHSIRDEEIRALVRAELEQVMAEPVMATNQWGEPAGKPTTLRALIVEAAHTFFTKRNDEYRQPKTTAAERIVAAEIEAALTKELKAAVAAEKEKVVAAVRAKAADLIAQAVREGVGR